MKASTLVLVLLQPLLVTAALAAETVHLKDRLRQLQVPGVQQPAESAESAAPAAVQVIDLRTAEAAAGGAIRLQKGEPTALPRKAGPSAARSLASGELATALGDARIALAESQAYANITPGQLVVPDRAITRIYGPGLYDMTADHLGFYFGERVLGEHSREIVGWVQVGTFLRESGVYVIDYAYSYAGDGTGRCSVGYGNVSQTTYLKRWQDGAEAEHLVVAVNYTAPAQWPDTSAQFAAILLSCYVEDATGWLNLYGINVTKP